MRPSPLVQLRTAAEEEAWALRFSIATPRAGWLERAACRGDDLDAWYPDKGVHPTHPSIAVCRRCPVRLDCGADAWRTEDHFDRLLIHGIRAGFSAQARWRQRHYIAEVDRPRPAHRARVVA